ncbi:hypothetical protein M5D96_012682 [Drosophila gunungcola]|uniref:Uncharacterized protein n=1 Tax=Drosophila gunungcola TaxID=103775 RepID=A0A9P9YCT0_9MUSC|nr:hypothetical protein M5D96_012682 [Drosophila gunungcola]
MRHRSQTRVNRHCALKAYAFRSRSLLSLALSRPVAPDVGSVST